ncbi:hypothetical protein [Bacillus mycoides]|nr:hypothetical protein [Bacillus mycoides]
MATNEQIKNQLANRKASTPATPDKLVEGYMKKMAPLSQIVGESTIKR